MTVRFCRKIVTHEFMLKMRLLGVQCFMKGFEVKQIAQRIAIGVPRFPLRFPGLLHTVVYIGFSGGEADITVGETCNTALDQRTELIKMCVLPDTQHLHFPSRCPDIVDNLHDAVDRGMDPFAQRRVGKFPAKNIETIRSLQFRL